jgi:hypothetical protein
MYFSVHLLSFYNRGVFTLFFTAAMKNIDAPMLTRVWQELEYRMDVCRVTRGAHIEHL